MSHYTKPNTILPTTYPIVEYSTNSHQSSSMFEIVESHLSSVVNSIYSLINTWKKGSQVSPENPPIIIEELNQVMVISDEPYDMV